MRDYRIIFGVCDWDFEAATSPEEAVAKAVEYRRSLGRNEPPVWVGEAGKAHYAFMKKMERELHPIPTDPASLPGPVSPFAD